MDIEQTFFMLIRLQIYKSFPFWGMSLCVIGCIALHVGCILIRGVAGYGILY